MGLGSLWTVVRTVGFVLTHRAIQGFEQKMMCWWKVKAALFRRPTAWGAGGTYQKANSLLPASVRAFKGRVSGVHRQRAGATRRKNTVGCDSHLELVMSGLTSITDCFRSS